MRRDLGRRLTKLEAKIGERRTVIINIWPGETADEAEMRYEAERGPLGDADLILIDWNF